MLYLYYKATAGCGVGVFCGGLGAQAHRPRCSHPGSCSGVAAPACDLPLSFATRCTLTGPIRMPCSVVPPPRSSSSTYRIRTPLALRGPLLLGVSSYPPAFLTPLWEAFFLHTYVHTTLSEHYEFQFSASNFQLRAPNFQLRAPNFQLRAPNFQLRAPNFQLRAPNSEIGTFN